MSKSNRTLSKSKKLNLILFNLILWLISFSILLFSFNTNGWPQKIDYIYTVCFIATLLIPVFINLYIFIPLFLQKEKYIQFTFLFITNVVLFSQLNAMFFDYFIDYFFPDYYFISYHSNIKLITIFSIFLISFTLIKIAQDWFYFNRNKNRELYLENQQIQSQLTSLRSQINPHFLFNSLNVIYSLAMNKKKETTEAIVQLSDILRYVIYDSNTERVLLKDEILLLEKYIGFQKYRHHSHENIQLTSKITNGNYKIYPMLLLPLIENSFKHGIKGDTDNAFINIEIEQVKNNFSFLIENNKNNIDKETDKGHSGMGLESIEKNLKIVYPNKHIFKITKSDNKFVVLLKLINYGN